MSNCVARDSLRTYSRYFPVIRLSLCAAPSFCVSVKTPTCESCQATRGCYGRRTSTAMAHTRGVTHSLSASLRARGSSLVVCPRRKNNTRRPFPSWSPPPRLAHGGGVLALSLCVSLSRSLLRSFSLLRGAAKRERGKKKSNRHRAPTTRVTV